METAPANIAYVPQSDTFEIMDRSRLPNDCMRSSGMVKEISGDKPQGVPVIKLRHLSGADQLQVLKVMV